MLRHTLVILGVIFLSALIAYRAYAIPFTHDEASTWLNYRQFNVWTCLTNPGCWGTANNHWLNTLLLQYSASVFGEGTLALRLPNVFAGWGYLVAASLIATRYIHNYALLLAGFLFLSAHVYLLDFFSLARGYGLMACGVIWGIYSLLRYVEQWKMTWLILCIASLFLSILSNFTALLPCASIGAGWLISVLVARKFNLLLPHGACWIASGLVLFFLLRYPIQTLAGSGEFEWGAANPVIMAVDLMQSLLYGVRYVGDKTFVYALYLIGVVVGIILMLMVLNRNKELKHPVLLTVLLVVLNVVVILVQQKITGAQAPIGRKSIYLIPFIFCVFVAGMGLLKNTGTTSFLGIILSLALVGHMIRTLPLKSAREWYYDAYYPELLSSILPQGTSSDSIGLGSTWIFQPSLTFYQKTIPLPIRGLAYQRPLVIDSTLNYYYVEPQDTVGLKQNGFDLYKKIGPFLLYKRE